MYKDLVKGKDGFTYEEFDDSKNNNGSNIILKIIIFLFILQIIRIISKKIIFIFVDYNELNQSMVSSIIMILILVFIVYKSKSEKIYLNVFAYMKTLESRAYYIILTIAHVMLILTYPMISKFSSVETFMYIVTYVIILPIYEEIIFRSYLWGKLEKEYESDLKVYAVTTVLFSLWNIGYIDNIVIETGFDKIAWLLFIKCSMMLSYGIFIGFFKLKIKNSYSCMLIHSFINIFGI